MPVCSGRIPSSQTGRPTCCHGMLTHFGMRVHMSYRHKLGVLGTDSETMLDDILKMSDVATGQWFSVTGTTLVRDCMVLALDTDQMGAAVSFCTIRDTADPSDPSSATTTTATLTECCQTTRGCCIFASTSRLSTPAVQPLRASRSAREVTPAGRWGLARPSLRLCTIVNPFRSYQLASVQLSPSRIHAVTRSVCCCCSWSATVSCRLLPAACC